MIKQYLKIAFEDLEVSTETIRNCIIKKIGYSYKKVYYRGTAEKDEDLLKERKCLAYWMF